MRSGWPHAEDGQPTPANQGQAPFGPQVSWPNGFSQLDHQGGNYRYPAPQLPAGNQSGAHPYASFNAAGYGDDGYTDPGYQGPSAQHRPSSPAARRPAYPRPLPHARHGLARPAARPLKHSPGAAIRRDASPEHRRETTPPACSR